MFKRWIGIIAGSIFVVLLPLYWFLSYTFAVPDQPEAKAGRLDLSGSNFHSGSTVKLNGEWEFYRNQLLSPQDFSSHSPPQLTQIVHIPGRWNAYISDDRQTKATGYATFRLLIHIQETDSKIYGIRTTNIRMANKIFINGQLAGSSGDPAATASASKVNNIPYIGFAAVKGETVEIIVQVSNFVYGSGGIIYPIVFGDQLSISKSHDWSIIGDLATSIGLIIPALYFLLFYWIRKREAGLLFLGIFCLLACLHVITHGEKLLATAFPVIPYEIILKLQAITPVVAYYYLICYGSALNSFQKHKPELSFFKIGTILSLILTIVWPIQFFSKIQVSLITFASFSLFYGLYILFKGISQHRRNQLFVWISMASILCIVIISMLNTFDLLENQWFISYEQLIFVIMQALILANRFNQSFNEVEQLSAKLLTIDGLRDEFLANTSHELRTPLHGIINMADSLVAGIAGSLNEKLRRDLSTIAITGRRLSYLINDILDFAKLKNGKMLLHRQAVNLSAVIQSVLEVIMHTETTKKIRFIQECPDDLPWLDADENRLRQILYNLLGNAVKYTQQGDIKISATVDSDNRVTVTVSDTGKGIAKERLASIFQSFDQGGDAVNREYDGMGLGLSITKRLVELGGGHIGVESELGVGSVFYFTVPAVYTMVENKSEAQPEKTILAAPVEAQIDSNSAEAFLGTILLVDDLPINLRVLENLLAVSNYRVVSADRGDAALNLLAQNLQVDLIIVDWVMPEMSGLELCRIIRERYSLSELPVLMLTANSRAEDIQAGFEAGVNDYLTKPVEAGELRARVNTLVKLRKSVQMAISSELAFLQAQIKPHFLYNALNTAIAVCPDDPKMTMQLLIELSRYLRASFNFQNNDQLTSLQQELELIKSYLYLEKARFDDRLNVEYEIDEDCLVLIPPLSIQPIIENAIRHGIMQRAAGGHIRISIKETQQGISVSISDDGVGIKPERLQKLLSEEGADGIGLKNINSRLLSLFGKGLQLESEWTKGTTVRFEVPRTPSIGFSRSGSA